MSKLTGRLAKLEQHVGSIGESRYQQALFDLQPELDAMFRQGEREDWPVLKTLYTYLDLHTSLPPNPSRRLSTPEQQDRAVQAMLARLNQYVELSNADTELFEDEQMEKDLYLASQEHHELLARIKAVRK